MASTKLLYQNGHNNHFDSNNAKKQKLDNGQTTINDNNQMIVSNGFNNSKGSQNTNNNNNNNNNDATSLASSGSSKSAQALIEVRKRFLEYAEQNPDKVNERDKHKLATDDWYLKRYLLARNRNVKHTLDMLRKTMEWRNEFGIHISEDAMFPLEFYKIGALFPYELDKQGNMVLYLRIKYHRKITEMVEVEKHFLVHTFEKIDRITNGQGLVIIFDCQGAGYANCDVDFLQFLITCAVEHAPIGLKYIVVYKLPWVLNAFWSIARKLLPTYLANLVKFCDEKSIRDLIDEDKLPDFMDGTCKRNYRWVPSGCPSVFKLANAHGITDAEIDKILPQFQALLDEAEEAMANSDCIDPPESITRYINNAETAPHLLSDLALCSIGLGSDDKLKQYQQQQQQQQQVVIATQHRPSDAHITYGTSAKNTDSSSSVVRLFPYEFVEFVYDAYNDTFHASVTLFNPSETNSLAFKLMSNRPSNYSVKPARGVLSPNNSVTISIILLNEHKSNDKFLIVAQPLEGEIQSISKADFDLLWSDSSTTRNTQSTTTQANIKLGSYLKKIVTSSAIQSTIKNPQLHELITTCRSLKRRQSLSIMINIILLIIIINLLFFNN